MTYQFAPIQSAVLGGFIAITDLLLRPGQAGGGVEGLMLYFVQGIMIYGVYHFQTSSGFCGGAKSKIMKEGDLSHLLMKSGLATFVLWGTDQLLRPANIVNLPLQALKFLIQGAILYHVFAYTPAPSTVPK